MKKRLISLLLTVCMVVCLLPATSLAADSGTCGDNLTWSLSDDGTLTISGNGAMTNYGTSSYVPWYSSCSSIKAVVLESGVTSISKYAFFRCYALTTVTIPDSVTSIGTEAFYCCYALTTVTIPDSVTSIGSWAFTGCNSLTAIYVDESNQNYASVDGILYDKDITTIIEVPQGIQGAISIPDGVTSIGEDAFYNRDALTSVTIPDSVTSIGESAFGCCGGLTSVLIGSGVTSIGESAFGECVDLSSVIIGSGVTAIGYYAFYRCTSLTDVYYSGTETQWNAISISSGNSSLTSATIYYDVFGTCGDNLTWLLKDGVLTIGGSGSMTNWDTYSDTPWYDNVSSITAVVLESGVTSIGNYAFYGCSGLTSVTIPDGVTSIGRDAFYGCSSLTSVTIPDSVTSIGQNAFYKCTSLTSVTIGSGVTSIGYGAFSSCSSLTDVCYSGTKTQWSAISIGSNNIPLASATIHYIKACGDNLTWLLKDGVLTISGSGSMTNWDTYSNTPWYDDVSSITAVVLESGVTSIGNYAFFGCSDLTSVTTPNSVTSIGDYAFCYCEGLTSITIPNSVTSIGNSAFESCTGLTSVYYTGTEDQWNAISFGANVWEGIPDDCKLYCLSTETEETSGYFVIGEDSNSFSHNGKSFFSDYKTVFKDDENAAEWVACEAQWMIQLKKNSKYLQKKTSDDGTEYYVVCPSGADHKLSDEYWNKLTSNLQDDTFERSELAEKKNEIWHGSCCGVALSMVYTSEDKLTNIFGSSSYYSLGKPVDNETLRDVIEYYQLCQYTSDWANGYYTCRNSSSDQSAVSLSDFLKNLVAEAQKSQNQQVPFVLDFGYDDGKNSGGHTVVVCGYAYDDTSSLKHKIQIYDCNQRDGYCTMSVAEDYSSFEFTDGNHADTDNYIGKHWTRLGYMEIDSLANASWDNLTDSATGRNKKNASSQKLSGSSTVSVYVPMGVPFTLTNAAGQTLVSDGSQISGTMELFSSQMIVSDSPELRLEVSPSDSFTVTGMGDEFEISAEIDGQYYMANTTGADEIFLSKQEGVAVKGTGYFFKAAVNTNLDNSDMVAVSGETTGKVVLTRGDDSVQLTAESECKNVSVDTYKDGDCETKTVDGEVQKVTVTDATNDDVQINTDSESTEISNPFTDVTADDWFYDPVLWAVSKGITNGTSDTTFSPNNDCTRGQIVTFLWRAAGEPEPTSSKNPFTDVSADQYYYKAVLWAVEKGITNGMTETTFEPGMTCTRAQAVTFLWRANGKKAVSASNPFTDVPSGEWYTNAVLWAVANEITNGMTATTFEPNRTCTRGHIVTFLYRAET